MTSLHLIADDSLRFVEQKHGLFRLRQGFVQQPSGVIGVQERADEQGALFVCGGVGERVAERVDVLSGRVKGTHGKQQVGVHARILRGCCGE
jgi:hypothetical protein